MKLTFEKKPTCNEYLVKNERGDVLGDIAFYKVKGHKNPRWWFFVNGNPMDGGRDFWLSEGCLRTIATYIASLKVKFASEGKGEGE